MSVSHIVSTRQIIIILCFFIGSCPLISIGQNHSDRYSQNAYGGIGLIETPTARFSQEGELLFGISSEKPYNRLFAKMQFFPWMEAVLRYTEGTYTPYYKGNSQTWKDKGLDAKFRLYENLEQDLSIALGLNDLGGTGAFSGEYIVASKTLDNFDISFGLGWGRLSGLDHMSNFIAAIDKERRRRARVQGAQRVLERRREGKCLEWLETFLLGRRFRRRKNHHLWGG
mgnify:CR=1 FL=1